MRYDYKCTNPKCLLNNQIKEISKPIADSSKPEKCFRCKHPMQRVFNKLATKTMDGFKV